MQFFSSQKVLKTRRVIEPTTLLLLVALVLMMIPLVSAFSPSRTLSHRSSSCCLKLSSSEEDDINQGLLLRAKELLAKSKAKLAAQEANYLNNPTSAEPKLPFFANARKVAASRTGVIKSKNADGFILADGERMAALSEQEEWERRGLFELFESEIDNSEDVYAQASGQLASRDVAASIFNLRRTLQQEDYSRIFDKRNYFIGEDN